jgi:hypothetical protein
MGVLKFPDIGDVLELDGVVGTHFVVEEARWGGGGSGHGPGDEYAAGWKVHVRQLDAGDVYNPHGGAFHFYMHASHLYGNKPADAVRIVGHMHRQVTFVK